MFSPARLKQARLHAGFTQERLADKLGIRPRQIIRWENAQHRPRIDAVAALALATDRPISYFFESEHGADDDEEEDLMADLSAVIRRLVRSEIDREQHHRQERRS